jgi:hypothetical protein
LWLVVVVFDLKEQLGCDGLGPMYGLESMNLVDQVELSRFNGQIWPETHGPFHGSVCLENKLLGSNPLKWVEWFEFELMTGLDSWAEGGLGWFGSSNPVDRTSLKPTGSGWTLKIGDLVRNRFGLGWKA